MKSCHWQNVNDSQWMSELEGGSLGLSGKVALIPSSVAPSSLLLLSSFPSLLPPSLPSSHLPPFSLFLSLFPAFLPSLPLSLLFTVFLYFLPSPFLVFFLVEFPRNSKFLVTSYSHSLTQLKENKTWPITPSFVFCQFAFILPMLEVYSNVITVVSDKGDFNHWAIMSMKEHPSSPRLMILNRKGASGNQLLKWIVFRWDAVFILKNAFVKYLIVGKSRL